MMPVLPRRRRSIMIGPDRATTARWAVGLVLMFTINSPASAAWGTDASGRTGRLYVGLGVQGRSFETMSYSDIRPVTHGEFGGRAEIGYRIAGPWWATASGHFGGAWFDFSGPDVSNLPPIAGKIEDFSWLIRGGLDRRTTARRRAAVYFGLGGEYGESRSWLHSLRTRDEGPHAYIGGGYLKAGAMTPVVGPVHAYIETIQSAYHAHARRVLFENRFNWLGRSFEGAAGIRLVFGRTQERRIED